MERFELLQRVGEGTFGEVHKAKDIVTGDIVALKRVRMRTLDGSLPNTVLREVRALRELDHPNVVQLLDVFPQGSSLVLVFELMRSDLAEVLRVSETPLSEAEVKAYMLMLLKGVAYCHENSILHRDLKPSNLLVSRTGELRIGDFGLARVHVPPTDELYTQQVATRWFRAPELLFGARKYGQGVDMWAVGAVFAELLGNAPIFPGESDLDQIVRILQVLGTPSEKTWPTIHELPDFNKIAFPTLPALPLATVLPSASPEALDLLSKLLVYDPSDRIAAKDALKHPFFFVDPLPVDPVHFVESWKSSDT